MKIELEQRLIEAYPSLYRDVNKPQAESLMCFGFECLSGWFDILNELSRELTDLNEDIVAVQVKEKYGTLRFYIKKGSDRAFNLIYKAEYKSGKVCESCGKPGEMRNIGGWLRTLCSEDYANWPTIELEV